MKVALAVSIALGLLWPQTGSAETYVFSAPPRESAARGQEDYGPIAAFLSRVTGWKFVYRHPGSWLSYTRAMSKDRYDLVFDDPHLVSWRIRALGHTPLVKLPGSIDFVVVSKKQDEEIVTLQDLAGRRVCAEALPSLGTMLMQNRFTNPVRQPQIHEMEGFEAIVAGLLEGKCRGAVAPSVLYRGFKQRGSRGETRILYLSPPFPNQALSASARIPINIQAVIRTSLLTAHGAAATERLRNRFAGGAMMQATAREEYAQPGTLLDGYHGLSW